MAGPAANTCVSGDGSRSALVFFDTQCVLCNGSVRWLIRHDRHARLRFAPLNWLGAPAGARPDSIVLLDAEGEHHESDAALRIASFLGAPWSWAAGLRLVPRSVRDAGYRLIARNRIAWFGSTDVCSLPVGSEAKRFPAREEVQLLLERAPAV
jgi:predicted DCC family thiol-disulfide oxidoreductase YuxK